MRVKQAVFIVDSPGNGSGDPAASVASPLLEISPGLRFLDLPLLHAARHGFTDIIVLAQHLGEQIEAVYQGGELRGATIRVVREPIRAGSGVALSSVASLLDRWFLMGHGHSFFDFNPRALATRLHDGFVARLALRWATEGGAYVSIEPAGDIVRAVHAKADVGNAPRLVCAGVCLVSRSILDHLHTPCSIEVDVLPRLAQGGMLRGMRFDGQFVDLASAHALKTALHELRSLAPRPAALLDRDGVLNVDIGYAHRPDDLVWIKGAREAVLQLNEAGYYVFVITNQSGVARGKFSEIEMFAFHERMQDDLAEIGAHIDAFYHCPFHADAVVEAYRVADHPDRKPNPGMILKAIEQWPVNRASSFVIGDKETDMEAARGANLPGYRFDGRDLRATIEAILVERERIG